MKSINIKTISHYHQFMGLPKPLHPMVSLINFESIKSLPFDEKVNLVIEFYSIAVKRNFNAQMKYGQQQYDFNEGILTCMSPKQVLRIDVEKDVELEHSGWLLLVHPDFLWNTPLAKTIKQYEFFDYAVNEALFLSGKEEDKINNIFQNILEEYQTNIDKFSQDLIIAQLELLLKFADRFYHRQFITRKKSNHQILQKLDQTLNDYFMDAELAKNGLPTPQYIAQCLNLSRNYLGSLLKVLTGENTQYHIHNKLIEKAKERLSSTQLSVSEIAFELGFEHSQSFSRFFKKKTNQSPLAFRQAFN
jgi:AraC family transcriptional activator of pobA